MAQGVLEASVSAGESGPVIVLTDEVDLTCAEQLSELLAGGTRRLTIDVKVLAQLGADQMVTIRGGTEATPRPQPRAGGTQGEPVPGLRGPDADQRKGT